MRPSRLQKPAVPSGVAAKNILLHGVRASCGREKEQGAGSSSKEQDDKKRNQDERKEVAMSVFRYRGSKIYTMDSCSRSAHTRNHGNDLDHAGGRSSNEAKTGTQRGYRRPQKTRATAVASLAAEQWQEAKQRKWSPKMGLIAKNSMAHLLPVLGKRLLIDLEARDIDRYQKLRLDEKASGREREYRNSHASPDHAQVCGGTWARIKPNVRHASRATRLRARIVR